MTKTQLAFNIAVNSKKPKTVFPGKSACPFCDRNKLAKILAEDGSIILVENKYPYLIDTYQTVLIETDICNSELSDYSQEHLRRVIKFGIKHWLSMESSGDYKSVIFFKNHGPNSGGSIQHPHMQIVGLKNVDYKENVSAKNFAGLIINKKNGVELNVSTHPISGFYEFNIILDNLKNIEQMADYIQIGVHFVMNNLHKNCNSYNLFFYHMNDLIITKVIPRFTTSPILIGYAIPQVSHDLLPMVKKIQRLYF